MEYADDTFVRELTESEIDAVSGGTVIFPIPEVPGYPDPNPIPYIRSVYS